MAQDAGGGNHLRLAGALAGVGSGVTKVAVGHGFDTIKTRLQCAPPGTYKGAIDCLVKTVRNESVFALYKGASPPAVGWAAIDSVLLGSLHNYRLFLVRQGLTEPTRKGDGRRLTLLGHGIAGLFAGWTSALLSNPIEILKVKLQLQMERSVDQRQFKGPIDCAKQVIRVHGLRGLWQGLGGSLLFRSGFFFMFLSIEGLMRSFARLDGTRFEISPSFASFLSGGLASFTFWGFSIPADNVKNRIMGAPLQSSPMSVRSVIRHVYHTEGVKGFYRGFTPVVLRAFPVNASAYYVYESLMVLLNAEKTRA
ncbi:mitochondrial carrier [Sistotremastrum suecicum HHB10207 ss-3]|uniref:Mitochondrial carrier n=1 Tax=Sistotremastrum suecicum HHB10207 ss-3 TaxID=1314776 RepID=A0A166JAX2_9AGAM|nr:mitochondrial carrier [Sistotremastrum suecicum HHB10207 ss-3]